MAVIRGGLWRERSCILPGEEVIEGCAGGTSDLMIFSGSKKAIQATKKPISGTLTGRGPIRAARKEVSG
jgi:hypothetical protein